MNDLWNLGDFPNVEDLQNEIRNISYDGLGTFTGQALNFTRDFKFLLERGRRPNVPQVVVIMTDGETMAVCLLLAMPYSTLFKFRLPASFRESSVLSFHCLHK